MSTFANARKSNDITGFRADSANEKQRFDLFLSWLSPDKDGAGDAYEAIRLELINFFCARKCAAAEDLADETIERVAQNVGKIARNYTGDPKLYFYGVGRNVVREYYRSPRFVEVPDDLRSVDNTRTAVRRERQHLRLSTCLGKLENEERDLIMKYYDTTKNAVDRRRLSKALGITPEHLRVRVFRIRNKLRRKFFRSVNGGTGLRGSYGNNGATHRT